MTKYLLITAASLLAIACNAATTSTAGGEQTPSIKKPFATTVIADFDEPWAMTFLPEFNQALITEKKGKLLL